MSVLRCKYFLMGQPRATVISVTIVTKNFRFLYTVENILSKINEIKINHVLPEEFTIYNSDVIITTEAEKNIIKSNKIFIPKAFNHYYLFSNILLIAISKKKFGEVVVGIDPGENIGFKMKRKIQVPLLQTSPYNLPRGDVFPRVCVCIVFQIYAVFVINHIVF